MLLVYESGRTHLLGPTVITTSASKVQFSFGPIFFFQFIQPIILRGKKGFQPINITTQTFTPKKSFLTWTLYQTKNFQTCSDLQDVALQINQIYLVGSQFLSSFFFVGLWISISLVLISSHQLLKLQKLKICQFKKIFFLLIFCFKNSLYVEIVRRKKHFLINYGV